MQEAIIASTASRERCDDLKRQVFGLRSTAYAAYRPSLPNLSISAL
jgi:hypothetical protein